MTARLMAITEARSSEDLHSLEELVRAAAPGEVLVQLRDRGCSARELVVRGARLRALTRASGQLLLVNDRVDVALAVDADGVHLPAFGALPGDARALVGDGMLVSRALHDPDELSASELAVLDALVISPVMAPRKGRDALGLETLAAWSARVREANARLAIYALGGVSEDTALDCLRSGASGVAVLGAARDPARARRLIDALGIAR